jgi:hypothetical protein
MLTSGDAADMTPPADPERYKHHRFPGALVHEYLSPS